MNGLEKALHMLPENLRRQMPAPEDRQIEEIRLRTGRRASYLREGKEWPFSAEPVTEQEIRRLLEKATGASMHAAAAALAEGYFSCGGLRIGVCGTAAVQDGKIAGFRNYSSAAIRIPEEHRGICDNAIEKLYGEGYESTLIISRPGGGKTTALREMIRRLSDRGLRISVVDERNELSATDGGQAQFDLGAHTDVLTGVNKAQGTMMLLRAMNPQILAVDEITRPEDVEAVAQAGGCGAEVLASAHAADEDELRRRPLYRELLRLGVFKNLIVISGTGAGRRYTAERIRA